MRITYLEYCSSCKGNFNSLNELLNFLISPFSCALSVPWILETETALFFFLCTGLQLVCNFLNPSIVVVFVGVYIPLLSIGKA